MWSLAAAAALSILAGKCAYPHGPMVAKIETARAIAKAIAVERQNDPSSEITMTVEPGKKGEWRVFVDYFPAALGDHFAFSIRRCDGAIVDYVAGR